MTRGPQLAAHAALLGDGFQGVARLYLIDDPGAAVDLLKQAVIQDFFFHLVFLLYFFHTEIYVMVYLWSYRIRA